MSNENLWINPAKPEEQGSFCDTTSEIHYVNVSKPEAEDAEESNMRSGNGVVPVEENPSDYPDDQRFNLSSQSTDSGGMDYPTRSGPKRR